MTFDLKCSSCGAPMELGYFAPGDKIAKCPFCGHTVDLPDERPDAKEKVTEFEENEKGMGFSRQRKMKIVEKSSTASSQDPNSKELFNQVHALLDKMSHDDKDGVQTFTSADNQTINTYTTTSTAKFSGGEMPEEMKKIVHSLGVDLPEAQKTFSVNFSFGGKASSKKEKKKSIWKRLFGKE